MPVFALLPTPLGAFTLAADATGLCALSFPGEPFDSAKDRQVALETHPLLREAGRQLLAYLNTTRHDFDLPLSIQGTPFQRQVWQQLRTIPYGQTRTYGELAAQVGGRHKARAVGGAAHANPLAIIIPCHRLIGANGNLTGFGGGLPMKQALLELEGCTILRQKN
jgi:methylated-DNA-[protein]-cysteine S-methyltransferase